MLDEEFLTNAEGDTLKLELIERIRRNQRGKCTMRIRTLMDMFGYRAVQRLRQSSLLAVTSQLEGWGIRAMMPDGATASDSITIALADGEPLRASLPSSGSASRIIDISNASSPEEKLHLDPQTNPLAFSFEVADIPDRERSVAICHDIISSVWSFQPVCLHIEASDEFFSFAVGFMSTLLRRRATMVQGQHRSDYYYNFLAPHVLSLHELKELQTPGHQVGFPTLGAVYLVRDIPDDVQDDELIAAMREMFIPHTYRLKARFDTTTADPGPAGRRAALDEDFAGVCRWLFALAGAPSLVGGNATHFVDLASLLAEAAQTADTLAAASLHHGVDPLFRAGFESAEHMVLKNSALRHLRRSFPGEKLLVESMLAVTGDLAEERDPDEVAVDQEAEQRARPDLCVGSRIAVEIETLRGLARPGTNAFFGLENKLRRKLRVLAGMEELWIVVPSDLAVLAAEHLSSVVRNLQRMEVGPRLRLAFLDLHEDRPVFVHHTPVRRSAPAIRGASWRESRKPAIEQRLTWANVAGYSSLKARIQEAVIDPLRNPEKYTRYGIGAPTGLLLYGLPGCGKSLVGRVLAGELDLACRMLGPSDLTSMWLGEGVQKIRELFDWAIKQAPCLLIIDEFDAIAPHRSEHNMHSDDKRQVNELLAQLDRIGERRVAVVATTNYVRGIDAAIRRSGRFDFKIPVFPPTLPDRRELFAYYLSAEKRPGVDGLQALDISDLAERTPLYTPADIKAVTDIALRTAVFRAVDGTAPRIVMDDLLGILSSHQRAIRPDAATGWIEESRQELGQLDEALLQLEAEVRLVYGG